MGLNFGYSYTARLKGHKGLNKGATGGIRSNSRPIKVFSPETKKQINLFTTLAKAHEQLKIAESSIRQNCKKNANKEIDECKVCNGYIFMYGEEPVF